MRMALGARLTKVGLFQQGWVRYVFVGIDLIGTFPSVGHGGREPCFSG